MSVASTSASPEASAQLTSAVAKQVQPTKGSSSSAAAGSAAWNAAAATAARLPKTAPRLLYQCALPCRVEACVRNAHCSVPSGRHSVLFKKHAFIPHLCRDNLQPLQRSRPPPSSVRRRGGRGRAERVSAGAAQRVAAAEQRRPGQPAGGEQRQVRRQRRGLRGQAAAAPHQPRRDAHARVHGRPRAAQRLVRLPAGLRARRVRGAGVARLASAGQGTLAVISGRRWAPRARFAR